MYSLMLGTLVLVLVLALAGPVKTFTGQARSDMSCSDPSISDYDKATCYGWDIILWIFVLLGIAIAFVVIGSKISGG